MCGHHVVAALGIREYIIIRSASIKRRAFIRNIAPVGRTDAKCLKVGSFKKKKKKVTVGEKEGK